MGWARGVIEVSYFRYSDKQIYYEETGEGVPLILLHGNTSCGMGANKSDSVLDGDGFSIVINKSASSHQAVAVVGVWTTGKYKCTGFHLALVAQQFRCVEGASTTAASFTPGSFCKTIEKSQTPNPSPAGIWRYYELP